MRELMKIGLVIEFLPEDGKKLGGVTVAVHRLANGLVDAGHEVVVVAINDKPKDARYQLHKPFHNRLWQRLLSNQLGLQLYSFMLNFCRFPEADVWHFHGYDHFVFKRLGPRLRTFHGSSYREMQVSESFARKLLMFCNYLWENVSIARSNRVLCIGSETASFFRLKHVVDNPFDPKIFRPGIKSKHPRIFFNGYWSGRKRGSFLYHLFLDKILPVLPDAELVMLCNDVPAHPSVTVLKGITDQQLAEAYASAWLFCYPSIYEGFGMAYMEAMASGTAILSSSNTGADDVLDHGKYGLISDDKNFSENLLRLLNNPKERKDYEQLGLLRCANYQVDQVVKQHLQHYREVAKLEN